MELRHLRYFIAVAEEGSLTNAAAGRLHTTQPSLSRQIRDLELEVGVKLIERKARGIGLTAAGRVFLDLARLALIQIEVACEAARGTVQPKKPGFVIGFLLGQEAIWLSESLRILREEARDVEITLMTKSSPELADGLMQGKIDVALLRHEAHTVGLAFKFLTKEPLIAILPTRHRLARLRTVPLQDLARESFISTARAAPVLRTVIDDYCGAGRHYTETEQRCRNSIRGNVVGGIHGRFHTTPALCATGADPSGGRSPLAWRGSDDRPDDGL
jgi:LysR family hca operon transcriptional activator